MKSQSDRPTRKSRHFWQKIPAIWVACGLLFLALLLPLCGEALQGLLIGEETVCCMPDDLDAKLKRAELAKSLRPLSNLMIGGTMVAGIVLAGYAVYYFHRYYEGTQRKKIIVAVVLALVAAYVIVTLITMLLFFIVRNDLYFYERPWPGGSLYDDAWYNPVHWWKAAFVNPFA